MSGPLSFGFRLAFTHCHVAFRFVLPIDLAPKAPQSHV